MSRVNPRLADAESPYLEEAATQPVDWYPWGEAAFEAAREEDKPVLVDSGAVWCHWCHVMDHESYEDPATAELINERFVPIKLDRDERPDVDKRLQQAVGAITGRGGWPLTAFLTPDGDVFYGGTYFPREPTRGMPSLTQVLENVATFWDEQREDALAQADKLKDAVGQARPGEPGEVSAENVLAAVDQALGAYDPANGGFGSQPKFPHATTVDLLLWFADEHAGDRATSARQAAVHTLEAMSQGGVHDHLEGGFHRYSVDAEWHVPHFEKMLYDNALLLASLAQGAAIAGREGHDDAADLLHATAEDTVRFLTEVLEQPAGGFGGSQDADRRPETVDGPLDRHELDDGGYFTWTLDEVRALLDDETAKIATLHFGIDEAGDMPDEPGQNVLKIDATAEDIAEGTKRSVDEVEALIDQARQRLIEARNKRKAPIVDPTVYTDWNGMAITGLLLFDLLHDAPEARRAGLGALDRLLDEAVDDEGNVRHAVSEAGARVGDLVDDPVQLLPALIEAFHATDEPAYLDHARSIADVLVNRFQRDDGLLRFNATEDDPAPQGDQPTPSPGAQAALHLPRLARLTGEDRYGDAADELLEALAGRSESLGGVHGGTLHLAMHARLHEPPHVVVTGTDETGTGLREAALSTSAPFRTVLTVEDPAAEGVPDVAREAAASFEDETVAIVCRGQRCSVAEDVDALVDLLEPGG